MRRPNNGERENRKPLKMIGSSLEGRDFSNMNLENADFSFSSLKGTNFDGAILKNAKMRFSALDKCTFVNADLTNVDLSFSSLLDIDLTGARVEGANFGFTSQDNFGLHDLKVIGMLKQRSWAGVCMAMILGAILLYGINSIVFYTAQIYYTAEVVRAGLFQYLAIQNVVIGMVTVLMTNNLAFWLDNGIRRVFFRHFVLSVIVLVFDVVISLGIFWKFGAPVVDRFVELYPLESSASAPSVFYMIGPVMIANLFYFFIRQSRQISRKISDQEFQLLNLEKLKTRAELDALQARINPHFLYNALNSIASLVHENPDKAEEMTLLLSKLFRYTTGGKNNEYYDTVENEIEIVKTYLEVEKVRFGDRLNFVVEISDESLNQLMIPKFILQPIVENAIKHGISKMADQGCIEIKITEEKESLFLRIHDNGPLFAETMGAGYGIKSIQDKLKLLYGDKAAVELHNKPVKAVSIMINKSALLQHS